MGNQLTTKLILRNEYSLRSEKVKLTNSNMQHIKDIILDRIPTYESITEEQKQILIDRIKSIDK